MARPPRPGTRRSPLLPGRVDGRIVGWPMVVLWVVATASATWIQQDRPEQVPALLGLYACAGFFAHFYALLFMAGSRVRRLLFAVLVTAIFLLLIVHHGDEMPGRRIVTGGHWVELPTRPAWILPILCNVVFVVLLWIHALWLAFGTRPKPGWEASRPTSQSAPLHAADAAPSVGDETRDEDEVTPDSLLAVEEDLPVPSVAVAGPNEGEAVRSHPEPGVEADASHTEPGGTVMNTPPMTPDV